MILLEFLPQRSADLLFYIKYHSRFSNTFPAYIDRCVLIPVHPVSACTLINAVTQLQIFLYFPTAAADFGAGIPAINADELLASTFHFICQKTREHSPAIIMNTFPKTHIPAHLFHIQILDAHDIIGIGYLPRFFVQKILSLMCDMGMDSCYFLLLLFITVTALFTMAQFTLLFCQLLLGILKEMRICRIVKRF